MMCLMSIYKMKTSFVCCILITYMIFATGGPCTASEPYKVVFLSQGSGNNNCGPVCLAMAVQYVLGGIPDKKDVERINKHLNITDKQYKSIQQIADAASKVYGLNQVNFGHWTLEEIESNLTSIGPVIVGVNSTYLPARNYSYAGNHFVLVLGTTKDSIICHDPGSRLDANISYPINNFRKAIGNKAAPVVYGFSSLNLLGTAMVAENTHLYSQIASHDIEEGKIVYFKGWPIGDKTPLRKGEPVKVLNIYANYSESKYTTKIQTKIGKVGYVLNSDLTELKITAAGDRGEITALFLSLPYEYEGDTKLVDKDISNYKSFVKKYPNSAYANVALLKIADLHLYTFQDKETNGEKAARVEELQTIYKSLSDNIEDAQGKKVARELNEFMSHNKKRIINTDYEGSEAQHLLQMNERLFEFCPKILSEP